MNRNDPTPIIDGPRGQVFEIPGSGGETVSAIRPPNLSVKCSACQETLLHPHEFVDATDFDRAVELAKAHLWNHRNPQPDAVAGGGEDYPGCICWMHMEPNDEPGNVILHPQCPKHGLDAAPQLWAKQAQAPDAIVVFSDDVDRDQLQELLDLATRQWPAWQCLIVSATDAGVWVREPTSAIDGPELLDYVRGLDAMQADVDRTDGELLAKLCGGDLGIDLMVSDWHLGDPGQKVLKNRGEHVLDLDNEEAARLVELGLMHEQRDNAEGS